MKTNVAILFCVLLARQAHAQSYSPFPTDSAEWHFKITTFGGPLPDVETSYKYFLKDTVQLNEFTYSKVWVKPYGGQPIYLGGLREDDLHRIYFFAHSESTIDLGHSELDFEVEQIEHLLYDFGSLADGSSYQILTNSGIEYEVTCEGIDSTFVNDLNRPIGEMDVSFLNIDITEDHWIQGIGSAWNLLYPYHKVFESTISSFMCFHDTHTDTGFTWENILSDGYLGCGELEGVSDRGVGVGFSVYPNPSSSFISITGIASINVIKITDTTGRLVMTEYNKQQIDVAHLQTGIYFIEVSTDESRPVLRFVKE